MVVSIGSVAPDKKATLAFEDRLFLMPGKLAPFVTLCAIYPINTLLLCIWPFQHVTAGTWIFLFSHHAWDNKDIHRSQRLEVTGLICKRKPSVIKSLIRSRSFRDSTKHNKSSRTPSHSQTTHIHNLWEHKFSSS